MTKRKIECSNLKHKSRKYSELNSTRPENTRDEKTIFLIFCEGKKTEPNYFAEFRKDLKNGVVIVTEGAGCNTKSLLDCAIKYCKKSTREYDHKWIVFDKDNFKDEDFNKAVFGASNEGFCAAYSNEAFELWFLLHFIFLDTGIDRHQYCEKLEKYLEKKYEKNDPNIYDILKEKGNQAQAIEWARQLDKNHNDTSPAKRNPSTTVYKLVEELNRYM